MRLRLILKGAYQTNEFEWTTVFKTIVVEAPDNNYCSDWFVVGAELVEEGQQ